MKPVAIIGHNNPPSDADHMRQMLLDRNHELLEEAEKLVEDADYVQPITSEKDASELTDFLKKLSDAGKKIEKTRKDEKEPYHQNVKLIDAFFGKHTDAVETALEKAKAPMTDWLKKKADAEKAFRAQEAERLRKEAEEKTAEAQSEEQSGATDEADASLNQAVKLEKQAQSLETTKKAAHTIGYTAQTGLRKKWVGEIENFHELDIDVLISYVSKDSWQKALDEFVKDGNRECKGARIFEKESVVIR